MVLCGGHVVKRQAIGNIFLRVPEHLREGGIKLDQPPVGLTIGNAILGGFEQPVKSLEQRAIFLLVGATLGDVTENHHPAVSDVGRYITHRGCGHAQPQVLARGWGAQAKFMLGDGLPSQRPYQG